MKKNFLLFTSFLVNCILNAQQQSNDSVTIVHLEEVAVMAQRPSEKSATVSKTLAMKELRLQSVANNLPNTIQYIPSVVSYNEGGTGIGNTYYTIRGASANRINVTLNGMPIANPESQEMYWVNLPSISESLKSVQVQRGVGTSVAGSSSFGGNISLETSFSTPKPLLDISSVVGQYHTFTQNIALGTGLLADRFTFDLRFAHVKSDGYIRNGKVNHYNINADLSYYLKNNLFKLIYIHGIQHTGITWEGVSKEDMEKYGRRYNPAGWIEEHDGKNIFYDNETDNYYSHILQGIYSVSLNREWKLNAQLAYNNGYGYYENYTKNNNFETYQLVPQEIGGVSYSQSDMILRKLMRNNYYFSNAFANYKTDVWNVIVGGNYGYYDGNHYGKLKWVQHNQDIPLNYEWYRNRANKDDLSVFAKGSYLLHRKFIIEAELQGRFIHYKMNGPDEDLIQLNNNFRYNFFNPKLGLSYLLPANQRIYTSISVAHREPQREDLKESTKNNGREIQPEQLTDIELGYHYTGKSLEWSINGYYMKYKNQLVQTGQLSNTGYKFQQNMPNSYRLGVELDVNYQLAPAIRIGGNMTWSKNKIKDFTAYFDVYNNPIDYEYQYQKSEFFEETNISFSPEVVSAVYAQIEPLAHVSILWSGKYVGKMYYDNTSSINKQLADYFVSSLNISYSLKLKKSLESIDFQILINNIFNKRFIANAWTSTEYFSELNDQKVTYSGFFPQATRNILGRIRILF